MDRVKKYIERIVVLDIFRYNYLSFVNDSANIYLVSQNTVQEIATLINNNCYQKMTNINQVKFYLNCLDSNYIRSFGINQLERILIETKHDILTFLQTEWGGAWSLTKICENFNSSFSKSIIGTLYYYGINRTADQKRGEALLTEAANMGDSDALLWCIWKHPENAREYMERLVSLPESLANPEWLNPWKEHYNLWDVKEKQIVKHKIGF